ncbi:hypothetical protein HY388_02445 [Candidatus Daviesbacteria bacterium]|nr:hypothetical protein [Candidatus Daviesbacteria bacterium]
MTVELVTTSIEPLLGKKLKSYYRDDSIIEYNKDFATLTSPLMLTFYRQEQLDLANVLLLPKNKQADALKKHQEKFYWMYNSYQKAQILGLDYFSDELSKLEKIDYQNILQEIKNYAAHIKQQKQAIFAKIKPDGRLLTLVELAETFSALQDDRKKYNFIADHYLELFVAEFALRTQKNIDDLKFLLPDELALSLKRVNMKLIQARQKCFVMTCQGDKISNVVGDQGQAIAGVFANIDDVEESVIHGILASAGDSYYFRSTAKIILTIDQISKLLDGEILVTTMTSPDFVIGMKRAGAIITDIGGILSHAAIISRELGKPCIVGTKIATKVIHDGDVVELHCAKGTVKIIKQAKN